MIRNAQLQSTLFDRNLRAADAEEEPSGDRQQLAQENGSLRILVAELLIKNQNLRWALQTNDYGDPRVLAIAEGTPLRRNVRIAGKP